MAHEDLRTGSVVSRDGTRIGFRSDGSGPGVVLVQGAMGTAHNYVDLARALAPGFTVHTPDRRGRGLSPKPYDRGHDISRDVEDIDAVLEETGISRVFGLSSGAVITLEAARTLPRITRIAVYEPPFYRDGISHGGIRRLGDEIDRGDLASALVSSLLTAQTAPALLRVLPRPVARLLAGVVLRVDDRRSGPAAKLRDMLPGVRYDFHDVGGMDGRVGTFAGLDKPVLLLSGTESPAFLEQAVRRLDGILPQSRHVVLEGLDHGGAWNTDQGGHPEVVAAALREFFGWNVSTGLTASA